MKRFIKQQLREGLLNEVKLGMGDLPESAILVVIGHTLVLYNWEYYASENPIEGMIGRISLGYENGFGEVETVAAEKGYGPLMYELGAQYSYPIGIQCSRDGNTADEALRIWDYFNTQGESLGLTIKNLQPGDQGYSDECERGHIEDMPDYFRLYNTVVYCDDTNEFNTLEAHGEEFFDNVGDDYRDVIDELGDEYFNEKF